MTLTGWGVFLGLLVVAAIALIIRFVIRHRRGTTSRSGGLKRTPAAAILSTAPRPRYQKIFWTTSAPRPRTHARRGTKPHARADLGKPL